MARIGPERQGYLPGLFPFRPENKLESKSKDMSQSHSLISIRGLNCLIQAFLIFFISSLVLHLGQALGLLTLVSQP